MGRCLLMSMPTSYIPFRQRGLARLRQRGRVPSHDRDVRRRGPLRDLPEAELAIARVDIKCEAYA